MKNSAFLLIDDDQDDHFIFSNAMDSAFPGAVCSYAFNCPEAIDLLNSRSIPMPDYIFMDWSMPYMDAIECIRLIRQIPDVENTPIYILSGSKPSFEIEHVVGLQIKKVIKKQNSIENLAREIKLALAVH